MSTQNNPGSQEGAEETDAIKDDATVPRSSKKIEEAFSLYDELLAGFSTEQSPWLDGQYIAELDELQALLAIPVGRGDKAASGRLAKAFDAWVAHELRRAGFDADAVWPRAREPRVLPDGLAKLERRITKLEAERRKAERAGTKLNPSAVHSSINQLRRELGGRASASILGDFYEKQVDVVMSSWQRGPEILISTKTMVSSFGNNLTNRHEEAVGEIASLRRRHPMAASGFAFLAHRTVRDKGKYEQLADIVRRLRRDGAYDATMLLIGDWDINTEGGEIRSVISADDELGANQFFADIVRAVVDRTPYPRHEDVRTRMVRRSEETPSADEDDEATF